MTCLKSQPRGSTQDCGFPPDASVPQTEGVWTVCVGELSPRLAAASPGAVVATGVGSLDESLREALGSWGDLVGCRYETPVGSRAVGRAELPASRRF